MKEETRNYIVTTIIAVNPKCTKTALSHNMPLVINSLGGGHTHTNTHMHTDICTETHLRNQVPAGY